MTTFLFWNIRRKPLQDFITYLTKLYNIDIIILAESKIDPGLMLSKLNEDKSDYHIIPKFPKCNIQMFSKFPREYLELIDECENKRMAICRLRLPGFISILLAVAHFPSKFNWSDSSQDAECAAFTDSILQAEAIENHSRTVLVGDLNMNPFEKGLVMATGLHAVMSRSIAEKKKRRIFNKEYKFFYNPMWNFFGDSTRGPPGTYYYSKSEPVEYFWNIFDQVLVRPDLLNRFEDNDIEIIKSIGDKPLLDQNGLPNINIASDHLPLLFKLAL